MHIGRIIIVTFLYILFPLKQERKRLHACNLCQEIERETQSDRTPNSNDLAFLPVPVLVLD